MGTAGKEGNGVFGVLPQDLGGSQSRSTMEISMGRFERMCEASWTKAQGCRRREGPPGSFLEEVDLQRPESAWEEQENMDTISGIPRTGTIPRSASPTETTWTRGSQGCRPRTMPATPGYSQSTFQ